jgi:hypothetical protein
VSCPHTDQRNCIAERKHHYIVETGFTLLAHVFVPLNYWSDAFSTVWFLINRFPSQTIDMKTPLEHLLHETLNYTFLRYLGVHVGLIFDPITTISLYPLSR